MSQKIPVEGAFFSSHRKVNFDGLTTKTKYTYCGGGNNGSSGKQGANPLLAIAIGFFGSALLVSLTAAAQTAVPAMNKRALLHADSRRNHYEYKKALEAYKKIYEADQSDVTIRIRLAGIYRLLDQPKESAYWYSHVVDDSLSTPIDRFHYAQALCLNKDYNKSAYHFQRYRQEVASQYQLAKTALGESHLPGFLPDSSTYVVERLPINSLGADFSPTPFKNGLIYITARGRDFSIDAMQKSDETKETYFDLYFSEIDNNRFSPPVRFHHAINSHLHEGPLDIFDNGRQMIFTRNYTGIRKKNPNQKGSGKLRLYTTRLIDGDSSQWDWDHPIMLPFDDKNTSYGHPATDGKVLYFVSDKAGGTGKTDIYRSEFKNNTWGNPVNLGPSVNTKGFELFPSLAPDGTLYFASDGWDGLGGLDIYSIDTDSIDTPTNLGYPINTRFDDFGIALNIQNQSGYLSSSRTRENDDDIYRFYNLQEDSLYRLADSLSGIPVSVNHMNTAFSNNYTNRSAQYPFATPKSNSENNNTDSTASSDMPLLDESSNTPPALKKDRETTPPKKQVSSLVAEIGDINTIYFDYKQSSLREAAKKELTRLATIMKRYPYTHLEVRSHTDSRGSKTFNKGLSIQRGQSVISYLTKSGVQASHIKIIPHGEEELVNRCDDQHPCTEEEHSLNRRVSFMLMWQKH